MPIHLDSNATDAVVARVGVLLPDAPAEAAALWLWTWRAGRLVESFTREQLAAADLDMSEFVVLFALWLGGKPYRSTQAELAHDVVLTQSGVARALQRATAAGTVRKIRDPDDGRAQIVELTARGNRVVDRMMTTLLARFAERIGTEDPSSVRALADAALTLAISVDEDSAPPDTSVDPA